MEVDRGKYADARTPWDDKEWRASALAWAEAHLAALGWQERGPRWVRVRPWSVIVRFEVGRRLWFKANPPASRFEAGLTEALARWAPGHVLTPYAVDATRGWSLLPDGGSILRQYPGDERTWEQVVGQYAEFQRTLVPHADELVALGVPDARLAILPAIFDETVAANQSLRPGDRTVLDELRPRLLDWCDELAAIGITDSLDHADLHDGQIFAPVDGRFTFFDWGDAAVSHPFCSLLVTAQHAAGSYGDAIIPRLRDSYLEPWTADGHTLSELRRAASLAWRLGSIGRAASWGRLFPEAFDGPLLDGDQAEWLLKLADEPPF
ncbi:hypothetical protein [Kribbella sp. NPDC049227]|uniref:hypothetical protein n=1 Tax=Kribbella sp. NPDC049227 TaxID=3364113 RepID=UPI003710E5A7